MTIDTSKIVPVERPNWTEFYMNQAVNVSKRSLDSQTKVGCIFTDFSYHQISCGYNSPAKGLPDHLVPNHRTPDEGTDPKKYRYFLHSEINAIINSSVPLWSIQGGIKAFITCIPCTYCLSAMINCNLKELYFYEGGWSGAERQKEDFEFLVKHSGIQLFPQKRI